MFFFVWNMLDGWKLKKPWNTKQHRYRWCLGFFSFHPSHILDSYPKLYPWSTLEIEGKHRETPASHETFVILTHLAGQNWTNTKAFSIDTRPGLVDHQWLVTQMTPPQKMDGKKAWKNLEKKTGGAGDARWSWGHHAEEPESCHWCWELGMNQHGRCGAGFGFPVMPVFKCLGKVR